ncbi:hypothetical protein ACFX2J_002980 [Malus domestica]
MRQDMTGWNEEGAKMSSDGNKEEEEGDEEVIILCSTDVEQVIPRGKAERKFTQNLSCERTKRGTERFVSLRSVPSQVPNGT